MANLLRITNQDSGNLEVSIVEDSIMEDPSIESEQLLPEDYQLRREISNTELSSRDDVAGDPAFSSHFVPFAESSQSSNMDFHEVNPGFGVSDADVEISRDRLDEILQRQAQVLPESRSRFESRMMMQEILPTDDDSQSQDTNSSPGLVEFESSNGSLMREPSLPSSSGMSSEVLLPPPGLSFSQRNQEDFISFSDGVGDRILRGQESLPHRDTRIRVNELPADDDSQSQDTNNNLGLGLADNTAFEEFQKEDYQPPRKKQRLTPENPLKRNSEGLRVTEIPPQNIAIKLMKREIYPGKRCGTEKYLQRSNYQSIFPNFTVTNVVKPPCFLRKFTPDGKVFIAFSSDQMSIEVYAFKGPQAATHLFSKRERGPENSKSPRDQVGSEEMDYNSVEIRKNVFSAFFQLKFIINVAPPHEQLNRECSLFTEDSQYLVVGSTSFIHEESALPPFNQIYRNNESVDPNPRFPLEDYTIHLVNIQRGVLCDSRSFPFDKIFLSHNQGVYLYNNTLAVLSVQHQTIHIFHIMDDQLVEVRTIGRFCYEDDELLYSSYKWYGSVTPFEEMFINSLKHRLLVFVFRRAYDLAQKEGDLSGLGRFHQYYEQLRKLRIWKMQLLDEDHLLLKYSNEDVVTLKCVEPNSQHCVLVVYNISRTEIVAVSENTSEHFVDLFENFSDYFRNNLISQEARYSSSPSNNIHAREIHRRFRQTITSARFGGPVEATKRILAQLPISAQSYSASPYLDQALFSYDDHRVSSMERPKACGEMPIRFYGRDSNLYKFQIHAGILSRVPSHSSGKRLVAFTFHPSAPFAISVQRANAEYLVNFHVRLDPEAVKDL